MFLVVLWLTMSLMILDTGGLMDNPFADQNQLNLNRKEVPPKLPALLGTWQALLFRLKDLSRGVPLRKD